MSLLSDSDAAAMVAAMGRPIVVGGTTYQGIPVNDYGEAQLGRLVVATNAPRLRVTAKDARNMAKGQPVRMVDPHSGAATDYTLVNVEPDRFGNFADLKLHEVT